MDFIKYRLYHNEEMVFESEDINKIYFKLQRVQSNSAGWAMKYEGWKIKGVDNKGNEYETK